MDTWDLLDDPSKPPLWNTPRLFRHTQHFLESNLSRLVGLVLLFSELERSWKSLKASYKKRFNSFLKQKYTYVSWPTVVEDDSKATFSIAITLRCSGWRNSFPWVAPLTFDTYLILLRVKQVDTKYHFFSLWYDSAWYWTPVSRTISEHTNNVPKGRG